MKRWLTLTALAAMALASLAAVEVKAEDGAALRQRVMRILRQTPLIDGHNDMPWQYRRRVGNRLDALDFAGDLSSAEPSMHTDIPRLRAGGVGGQFWAAYLPIGAAGGQPGDARIVLEQIDLIRRLVDRHADHLELALTADDVERVHAEGRIASLVGVEGGHAIENSLAVLRATYELGARYMTLTHNRSLDWADAATDASRADGLTPFGKEVVREMNRLGMMVDLSHVAPATMHAALDVIRAPVVFTHSYPNLLVELLRRGYTDEELAKIAGQNMLRVMREAERVAEQLQKTERPSEATIEELDAEVQ
ncbi:MAG: membrane dipeptidase [Thermoguttaceae bacterium]|jgi:membrane dipeptidase|nr:membrane dipeptidase [Thermoguttaceae bacterium]